MKTKILLITLLMGTYGLFNTTAKAQDVINLLTTDNIATVLSTYSGSNVVLVVPSGYTNPQGENTIDLSTIPGTISKITLKGDGTVPVFKFKLIYPPTTLSLLKFDGLMIQGAAVDPTLNYLLNNSTAGAATTIDSLVFVNDTISNFRSIVRIRLSSQAVNNLVVNNCIGRSFSDYGFVYSTVAGGSVGKINVTNSTFYGFGNNFLLLQPGTSTGVNVANCTFDNLPGLTGKYLIDLNTNATCPITISNVILGKSVTGAKGIRSGGSVTITNSYTTSDWVGTFTGTPLTGSFTAYTGASTDLFTAPSIISGTLATASYLASYGNYKIKDATFAARNSAGDPRWYYDTPTELMRPSISTSISYTAGFLHFSDITNVKIYNVSGLLVKSLQNTNSLSTIDLKKGLYIVKAGSEAKGYSVQKFINK